jgi:hypothetical protein
VPLELMGSNIRSSSAMLGPLAGLFQIRAVLLQTEGPQKVKQASQVGFASQSRFYIRAGDCDRHEKRNDKNRLHA